MKQLLSPAVPVALAFLSATYLALHADPPRSQAPVEVLFAPTGKDRTIEKTLVAELDKARKSVDLAIFQFTSRELSDKIAAIRRKVKVRILFDAEQAAADASRKDAPSRVLPGLKGVEAKFVDLGGSGAEAPKFHHKFCVIDGETVTTGSYNWTVLADESNYENMLILRDPAVAQKYEAQFEAIWADEKVAKPTGKGGKGADGK